MTYARAVLLAMLLGAGVARAGDGAAPARRIEPPEHPPAPPPPGASPLAQPRGAIDWRRRVLLCSGVAAPTLAEETENVAVTRLRTERAARDDAVRTCLGVLRTVTVAKGVLAGALLDGDPKLAREVERVIRRAPVADAPRLFSDGGAAVRLAVPLDGRLSALLTAAAEPGARPSR